jgi:hypothetical protein
MSSTEEAIEFAKENRHINSLTYQIPASELLDSWYATKILFSPYLESSGAPAFPYQDEDANLLYSDTIAALLLGLPFPEPIVAEDLGGGRFSIVSGEQTMSTIIHYLGGMMPKLIKRTLSDDVEIFPSLSDLEFGKLSEEQQEELLRGVIVKVEMLDPYKPGMDSEDIAKFYGSYKN